MLRRIGLIIALGIVLSTIVMPVSARSIPFASWNIRVSVCTNGFTVTATGGTTTSGNTISVKALEADLLLPNLKPPFIQLTKPLPFTSATGSMLVASSSNPAVQVVGTAHFYFSQPVNIGASVQTIIEGYSNGAPLNIANGKGIDSANDCTVPPPPVQVNDLSGVIINPIYVLGNPLRADGRASPDPADRVIIYCLSKGAFAGNIVVNSVNPNGDPYRLGQYKVNDVAAAKPRGVSQPALDNRGELSLSIDKHGAYVIEWTNGIYGPYFVKAFTCTIDKSAYNKTDNQLLYPDTFGNDGRVAPNLTDKVAVYCLVASSTISIWGVDLHLQGFPMATFSYQAVLAATPNPVVKTVAGQGTVALQVDNDDNFFLRWSGGVWGSDQIKNFKCRF